VKTISNARRVFGKAEQGRQDGNDNNNDNDYRDGRRPGHATSADSFDNPE